MIRDAVGRIRPCMPVLAAIILSTTVAVGVIAMPVQATGGSADEQRRVNEIINELTGWARKSILLARTTRSR